MASTSREHISKTKTVKPHTAFFYGTLMAPTVLSRVIHNKANPSEAKKAQTSATPALLADYERRKVRWCDYPAITPCASASVRGTLVTGLTDTDLQRLDIFEGSQYKRQKVQVRMLPELGIDENADEKATGDEEMVQAETYVWNFSRGEELEDGEWDFEEFKRAKLHRWDGEMDWEDEGFADVDRAAAEEENDPTGGRMVNGAIGKELETLHAAV